MPSVPCVLIALQPSMYAEVLAFSVGRERPRAEVSILDPSESLEEAAGEGWTFFRVEVDEPRADEGAKKRVGARISADGYSESVGEVRIEDVLLALDWAEEELVSKGPGRVRGADRGEGA